VTNDWVADHTNDRIENIVPEGLPRPKMLLALANAIWFQAAWSEPFDALRTKKAPFTCSDGEARDVPLMRDLGGHRYCEDDQVQVLELPYRGGRTSMLVILPKAVDSALTSDQAVSSQSARIGTAYRRSPKPAVVSPS